MNNLVKSRWHNLLRKAATANRLIKKGYIVFDHFGHRATVFKYDKTEKYIYQGDDQCRHVWSSADGSWDSCMSISLKQFNADKFDKWVAVHPKDMKKI